MAAADKLSHFKPLSLSAARTAFSITPHDTNELTLVTTQLYVGSAGGDITVLLVDDSTPVLLKSVPLGTILNMRIKKVLATGTTATNLVGLS